MITWGTILRIRTRELYLSLVIKTWKPESIVVGWYKENELDYFTLLADIVSVSCHSGHLTWSSLVMNRLRVTVFNSPRYQRELLCQNWLWLFWTCAPKWYVLSRPVQTGQQVVWFDDARAIVLNNSDLLLSFWVMTYTVLDWCESRTAFFSPCK